MIDISDRDEIIGNLVMENGRFLEDGSTRQIITLISTQLKSVAVSKDGWDKLFQDPKDGCYWELTYPQGEMQGGPPALRRVSPERVSSKYSDSLL